jgi:hypothetical protein
MATKTNMRTTKDLTQEDKGDLADANHIWLNALSCISPTDEFLRGLGKTVLDKLNSSDVCCEILGDPLPSMKYIYISLNKS